MVSAISNIMKELSFYDKNNCSISGVGNDYAGVERLLALIDGLLGQSKSVLVFAQRPYADTPLTISSMVSLVRLVSNYQHSDDHFRLFFYYNIRDSNPELLNTIRQIWREYEQPVFLFPAMSLQPESYVPITADSTLSSRKKVELLASLAPCYQAYKGVEEDVLWIEKDDALEFDWIEGLDEQELHQI